MKKIGLAIAAAGVVLFNSAAPASAFTNPLKKFSTGLQKKLDRFYLQYIPGDKGGEMVLRQSAMSMADMKTAKIKAEISGKVDSDQGEEMGSGKMSFSGPIQVDQPSDPLSAKQDFTMEGELSMGGTTLKASADFKQDGKDMYVKINVLPVLPFFDATKLKGQWLKMPLDEMEKTKQANDLTEAEKDKLAEAGEKLLSASQISKATKAKKNGQDVYVVEISVPDSAIVQYVETVTEVTAAATTEQKSAATKKSLEDGLAAMDDIKAVVWVDQKTFYTTHVELPLVVDLAKVQDSSTKAETSSLSASPFGNAQPGKLTGAMTMDFSDFNQPVSFEVPTNAKDFQAALMETMSYPGLGADFAPTTLNSVEKTNNGKANKAMPVELQKLSPAEKKMLEEYGVDVEDIIP